MSIWIGADPGEHGAIVGIREDHSIALAWTGDRDGGYFVDGEPDARAITARLRELSDEGIVGVWIETPFAPGRIGTANAITIGIRWGLLFGAILAARVPVHRVTPAVWSKALLGSPPKGGWPPKAKKQAAIRVVGEMLPALCLVPPRSRVAHDGLADAACLAIHGLRA